MDAQDDNRRRLRQAMARHQAGDIAGAQSVYRQLLPVMPEDVDLLFLIGTAELQSGRFDISAGWFERVLARRPDHPESLCNLATAYRELRRLDEALALIDRALTAAPDRPDWLMNRGQILNRMRRHDEALAAFDRAAKLSPDNPMAHNNLGAQLRDMGRFDEALAAYDRALALRPDHVEALNNRGNALKMLKRTDEAMQSFDRALALRPNHVSALWNKALLALLIGDFAAGWPLYEWRWHRTGLRRHRRDFAQPQWRGEDIAGKRILLQAEQGLGDTVQFIRYAPLVCARGAKVIIEAQKPLLPLIESLEGDYRFVAAGDKLPDFDCHCPLMSLPLAFGTELATIPAATPYLFADPARRAIWRGRLGEKTGRRIGLAWAGKPSYRDDARRSLALAMLAPLLKLPFAFHAVQKDIPGGDGDALPAFPSLVLHTDRLTDFAETAALIAELDLVISVDTAVAHVAGALGRPVWLLLPFAPDWRWLLDRDDSPWYPTARLFRQPKAGDWKAAIADAGRALERLL